MISSGRLTTEPFYKFRAEAGDEPASAELLLFAAIGDWEELGEVSAKAFARDLSALPTSVKRLDIHINSPGGSVFEASAIYSRLADHKSTKHVYVDGLAASAASIIAMVGHKIFIRANANMMIHLPSGFAMGNADDMRTVAAALDSVTESMINVYARRTKLDREEIRSLMSAETWMSPQVAVEKGFADEMRGKISAAAIVAENKVIINGVEHDLSRFHNVPFTGATEGEPMPKATKPQAAAAEEHKDDDETETPTPPATPPATGTPATETTPPQKPPTTPPHPAAATAETDYDKGVKAERDRVTALNALDKPATHAIVAKAIAEGKTVADIAAEVIEAMDKASKQTARRTDASQLDGIPGSGEETDEHTNGFGGKIAKAMKSRVKSRNSRVRITSSRN